MMIIIMFSRSFFSKAWQFVRSYCCKKVFQIQPTENVHFATLSIFPFSLYFMNKKVSCKQSKENQTEQEFLSLVSMSQLVRLLHQQTAKEFVVLVYNKFEKANHPEAFAALLKDVIEECKKGNIDKFYAISAGQQQYLRQIQRRLRNMPAEPTQPQQDEQRNKKKKVISCFFKNKGYKQAFELLDSKDYKISQQIKQIRYFQIRTNNPELVDQLNAFSKSPFDINRCIVVQQCTGQGQCVQNFKKSVRRLLDEGLLTKKTQQYQFQLVVDYPTGILYKSNQFVKNFESNVSKLTNRQIPHRKQETYLFRRDIIGKEILSFSQWAEKEENNQSSLMMFIRPRVNIISKLNTLTDLLWYFKASSMNNNLSFSINNTQKWTKFNKVGSLDVLKLLYSFYPKLNYLIVNSSSAGDIIKHVHANHKYVIFQQSRDQIWRKIFLDLDLLQQIQSSEERQIIYKSKFKQQIDSFIKQPKNQDLVAVEKQLQISLERLKNWKHQQQVSEKGKPRLIRVCKERCQRFLDDQLVKKMKQKLSQNLKVYWIDSKTQNIGVKPGDYLLKQGKLIDIAQLLQN